MSKPERPMAGWSRDEPWAQVVETHAAAVFLAGDLAWKLKKPVNLGFLKELAGCPPRPVPAPPTAAVSTPPDGPNEPTTSCCAAPPSC